ncbi:MAG: type II secretion system protein [Candidatus Hydrogenedentota bacterium]
MNLKTKKGFSLIDVLVASIIIGIGLVGVTRAIPISLKAYTNNEKQIYASILYYSAASYIKTLGFLSLGSSNSGGFNSDPNTLGLEGIPSIWAWQYTVKDVDDGSASDIVRQADIKISAGDSFSDTIPCIIFNDIINN